PENENQEIMFKCRKCGEIKANEQGGFCRDCEQETMLEAIDFTICDLVLENCPLVTRLEANNNELTNIDFVLHQLPRLTKLEVRHNNLTSLDISNNLELSDLDCGEAINKKREELENEVRERPIRDLKKAREETIEDIKNACEEEEKELPKIKKIIEKYSKKINKATINEISSLQKEANELILEARLKRQRLH
ncbi:12184_t:CDS:2, partial [Ambispora gerdemannii]